MKDYQEVTTGIGGKRANIRTYWQVMNGKKIYRSELNVGNWEKGQVELYMRLEGDDPTVVEIANQIFNSVVFPIPIPERPAPADQP